jgi:hypothetical protein
MIGYWGHVITVSQLSKSFAGRALFDDVSLQVNRGEQTQKEEAARTRVRRVRDDFWLVTSDV